MVITITGSQRVRLIGSSEIQPPAFPSDDALTERYAREIGPMIVEAFEREGITIALIFMMYQPVGAHGGSILLISATAVSRQGWQTEIRS